MSTGKGTFNLALWIAAVPVGLAAIRLLMFSRGDTTLLRVLLETMQVVPVLVGTALLSLPVLVLMCLFVLIMNRTSRDPVLRWLYARPLALTSAGIVVLLVAFVAPIELAIGILVGTALLVFVIVVTASKKAWAQRVARIANAGDNRDPFTALVGVIIVPLLLTVLSGWSAFWLPLEAVTEVGEKPVRAYVMSVTSEWTTLLTPDRVVIRMPSDAVAERVVCDQGTTLTFQTLTLRREESPPKCPA